MTNFWWRSPSRHVCGRERPGGRDSRRPADAGRAGLYPAQAAGGRGVLTSDAPACHGSDLRGGNEAPQLAGADFMNAWRSRTTRELFEFIHATMPLGAADLSPDQALAVTAFILQSNGATPGAQALAPTTAQAIGAVAAGQPPPGQVAKPAAQAPAAQAPAAQAPAARAARWRAGRPVGPRSPWPGIKNYTPVTDEMLRNPRRRLAHGPAELPGVELQPLTTARAST